MKTLVVAATLDELSGLYDHFGLPRTSFVETLSFDVLITGVGMTATAFALGRRLSDAYGLVLNLGIAGAFDRSIPLGEVVHITADTFAELGAEDKDEFLTIEALGFGKSSYRPLPQNQYQEPAALKKVESITVNKVHGNKNSIITLLNRLTPATESMEGAAVFYACTELKIPSMQIRSISNYVEERNRDNWKIGLAIKNLNQWAINFLTTT